MTTIRRHREVYGYPVQCTFLSNDGRHVRSTLDMAAADGTRLKRIQGGTEPYVE